MTRPKPCRTSISRRGWRDGCRRRRRPAWTRPGRPIPRCVSPHWIFATSLAAPDPELRSAAWDLADILGKPLPVAPARVEVRAKALVGFEAEQRTKRVGLFDWLFASDRRFVTQRAVALTAAVVIAVSGFMLGGGLGASVAEERYAMNTPQTTSTDTSNELTEFLVSDGI